MVQIGADGVGMKLDPERKAGKLLGELITRGGKSNSHRARLKDFGINKFQSQRCSGQSLWLRFLFISPAVVIYQGHDHPGIN